MQSNIEYIKKRISEIIFLERELITRRYTLYLDEIEKLDTLSAIKIWINNYRHIFSIYGQKDIDELNNIINT